jgi:hypothetical protein
MTTMQHPQDAINLLHRHMLTVAANLKLPQVFQDDLQTDLHVMRVYSGERFIWILRTGGTVMAPLNIGVDPIYVSYWLDNEVHGQKVIPFLVDTKSLSVEKITSQKALELIFTPPSINQSLPIDAITAYVDNFLREGHEMQRWGLFKAPTLDIKDWTAWLSYFSRTKNHVMVSFMEKAIRCRSQKVLMSRNKSA